MPGLAGLPLLAVSIIGVVLHAASAEPDGPPHYMQSTAHGIGRRAGGRRGSGPLPTSANCTWRYFNQPLDHFAGQSWSPGFTFKQRACFYEGFFLGSGAGATGTAKPSMVLFYVGNESPLDVYINNTGLMWNLGRKYRAALIFAEHRYEGGSVPAVLDGTQDCLAYCSSKQALADYALLVETLRVTEPERYAGVPVIAFGGSYGGMLAAWARAKYPHVFAGAVAGSAPILGVPLLGPQIRTDSASVAITRGLLPAGGQRSDRCAGNLQAAWILLEWALRRSSGGGAGQGADPLPRSWWSAGGGMGLCSAPTDFPALAAFLQSPFFLMAEGDYPFASNYITGAVGGVHVDYRLPPWPMKAACTDSGLDQDLGVQFEKLDPEGKEMRVRVRSMDHPAGNDDEQTFTLFANRTSVHFNATRNEGFLPERAFLRLVSGVGKAVSVWYNVTGMLSCLDWTQVAPNMMVPRGGGGMGRHVVNKRRRLEAARREPAPGRPAPPEDRVCHYRGGTADNPNHVGPAFSWGPTVCNDQMFLINTEAQGHGRDFFWPQVGPATVDELYGKPTSIIGGGATSAHPPGTECSAEAAVDPGMGPLFGLTNRSDPFGFELLSYYGTTADSMEKPSPGVFSNIVFSNGLLDPWSGAGFGVPRDLPANQSYAGPVGVELEGGPGLVAVILKSGAHHLDLMFPSPGDPEDAKEARIIEEEAVVRFAGLDRGGLGRGQGSLSNGQGRGRGWRREGSEATVATVVV